MREFSIAVSAAFAGGKAIDKAFPVKRGPEESPDSAYEAALAGAEADDWDADLTEAMRASVPPERPFGA